MTRRIERIHTAPAAQNSQCTFNSPSEPSVGFPSSVPICGRAVRLASGMDAVSVALMSVVWRLEAENHTQKLVLLALADNANDSGHCWPSIQAIAEKCDLTERAVTDHIGRLASKTWLSITRREGHSNTYLLTLPTPEQHSGVNAVHPRTVFTPPLNAVHPTPEQRSPPPLNSVHPEPSVEPSLNHQGTIKGASLPRARGFVKPTLEEVKLGCAKAGLPDSEGEHFWHYYESNGWRVGKNPMRSWPSALANWKKNFDAQRYANNPARVRHNPRNDGIAIGPTDYGEAAKRKLERQALEARNREASEAQGT